jgi:Protein of unknown function (DUF2490)
MEAVLKRTKMVVLIAILMLPVLAISQESNFGNWLLYIGNKQINQKWNVHNEVQYRNYNAIGNLEQLLIRVGLGYNLVDTNNNLLLGYGYILSNNYLGDVNEKISVNEHRIFQQFISKQNVGKLKLSHRYRFEQRFVENDFKLRLRYFLGLKYPLTNNNNDYRIYISAYNEIFLNAKTSVFDRNRLYGGLGYKVNSKINLEIGYMNQFFENSTRDQFNIITFITF